MQIGRLLATIIVAAFLTSCDRLAAMANGASTPASDAGAYLLLEPDGSVLQTQALENTADQMAVALRSASPAIRYVGRGVVGDAARIRLVDVADTPRARALFAAMNEDIVFTEGGAGLFDARLTPSALAQLRDQTLTQSLEVLRRRVPNAHVALHPGGRIIVRINAGAFAQDVRTRLTPTALLSFHLVREISQEEMQAGRVPPGTMLVQPYPGVVNYSEVVDRRPRLTGEHLLRAIAAPDEQSRQYSVAFQLDDQGTRAFCQITRNYTGSRFAVLLDNQVLTAPRINEPICAGSGMISGFAREDAENIALLLSAGALPSPLIIVAEGVGPAPN